MAVMAYDVTLEIDECKSVVKLDTTYPSVSDWVTATEFAIHLALYEHPDAHVEFIDCAEYEHEEYSKYGYIHPAPIVLQ
jgi:hypothetical protein